MKRKITIKEGVEGFEFYELLDRAGEIVGVVFEGDLELDEEDLGTYVRVEFLGGGPAYKLYCYEDPGLDLMVGDIVDVPTQYEDHNVAQVKALGRGVYKGNPAPVLARYSRIEA